LRVLIPDAGHVVVNVIRLDGKLMAAIESDMFIAGWYTISMPYPESSTASHGLYIGELMVNGRCIQRRHFTIYK
jgi:hypothetical protein